MCTYKYNIYNTVNATTGDMAFYAETVYDEGQHTEIVMLCKVCREEIMHIVIHDTPHKESNYKYF